MKKHQKGFTLVEIAIVLVIIGLLMGGVLKGQELINSAKVKNLANDFRSMSSFVYAYQDRFRAMPGDDARANNHVTNGTVPTTPAGTLDNARINGTWNSVTQTDESYLFWQHVRLAGLATGTPVVGNAEYIPRNAEGGAIGITGDAILTAANPVWPANFYICSTGIQGRFARQLDTMLDDGNTQTGTVRVIANGAATQANADLLTPANDQTLYTVCSGF
ncbi:prepilin-type N-terminal cleavage/methylation domain-containing protein [uncultured Dechloromonas sp.]|uniref:type II secretion system protein n=1 Tax=uncultured Dechloromonas sp. TaxID=171719 RepID=UPI0025E4D357|nr:prepilin-type N-terminal cleavage/methylation domain-containing protein [uncultured Dechloromonas sp.]